MCWQLVVIILVIVLIIAVAKSQHLDEQLWVNLLSCIFLRICFSLQEKESLAVTPPKQMQTLLFYWL